MGMAVLEGLPGVEILMEDGKRRVVGARSHGFHGKMPFFFFFNVVFTVYFTGPGLMYTSAYSLSKRCTV